MSSTTEALGPHFCSYCPPNFRPIVHNCPACPDHSRDWIGTEADHLLVSNQFADHRLAIHRRRAGVPRDSRGYPLIHVSPAGTRAFIDPGFNVHDVQWVESPSFVRTGRPHPKLEEMGFDVWEACAITGMPLVRVYYLQDKPRVNDGGMHEIFIKCRRADKRYSPIRLWEFRLDILEPLRAEAEAQRKLKKRQELLARHGVDEQELAIEAALFSRAWNRGAPADEERPIIYGDLL